RVPYAVSGGLSFFSRKEVKDILSYLAVTVNPDDDVNLLRIINIPRRGIGKAVLMNLLETARRHSCSLFSALILSQAANGDEFPHGRAKAEIGAFLAAIETTRQKLTVKRGMSAAVKELVDRIDYWGYLLAQNKKEQAVRFKYMNVESLVNSIADYENDPENASPSLRDYLHRISLLNIEENKDDEDNEKVNLMTVHAAKGLEFDTVFIAAAEEGLFPHSRVIEEAEEAIEEERRLFYVAMTRAKRKLFITAAASRRRMGEALVSSPSCFLEEIPEELCITHTEEVTAENDAAAYFTNLKERFK
ncbi:MAG TPA: AAA family ATPase, partial [Spirochaetia bacterium]|nr:AAA family ATPase [Spirochaetia bacterium]